MPCAPSRSMPDVTSSRVHAEGIEDRVHRCGRGRLVEAERDAVGVDAPDVDAPVCEGGRDLVRATRHDDRERVEERRRLDVEATVDEGAAQGGGEGAHALRDGHEPGGTVPHGIHARHDGEQHLRGADVGGRLLAADVLLARLQGQAVGLVPLGVDRDADEAAGDLALEAAVHGHVAGVRTAEAHRDAEALGAADGDVGAPLTRGAGQGEREQVGAGGHEALGLVDGRRQSRPVDDLAGGVGVLHQCADHGLAVGGGREGVRVGDVAQVGDDARAVRARRRACASRRSSAGRVARRRARRRRQGALLARRISDIASAAAVDSSRSDEPATSSPVRSVTTVWKLSSASRRPWEISGW